eukprot:jgi/Mesvir1/3759/Mv15033-RA.1
MVADDRNRQAAEPARVMGIYWVHQDALAEDGVVADNADVDGFVKCLRIKYMYRNGKGVVVNGAHEVLDSDHSQLVPTEYYVRHVRVASEEGAWAEVSDYYLKSKLIQLLPRRRWAPLNYDAWLADVPEVQPPAEGDLPILCLPIVVWGDAFRYWQKKEGSLEAWLFCILGLDRALSKTRNAIFPISLVPAKDYSDKFVAYVVRECLAALTRGVVMEVHTAQGLQRMLVRCHVLVEHDSHARGNFMGHLGCTAKRGCPFCNCPDERFGDTSYDVVANARKEAQTVAIVNRMAGMTQSAREAEQTKTGVLYVPDWPWKEIVGFNRYERFILEIFHLAALGLAKLVTKYCVKFFSPTNLQMLNAWARDFPRLPGDVMPADPLTNYKNMKGMEFLTFGKALPFLLRRLVHLNQLGMHCRDVRAVNRLILHLAKFLEMVTADVTSPLFNKHADDIYRIFVDTFQGLWPRPPPPPRATNQAQAATSAGVAPDKKRNAAAPNTHYGLHVREQMDQYGRPWSMGGQDFERIIGLLKARVKSVGN